uniref:Malectin-like domain-containing protein n=1 Tax=Kalanchoe fedtschenkoi TaxID=63787 RepID=A0A7N0UU73_KALFE
METSYLCFWFFIFAPLLFGSSTAQMPGFVSLDCGGEESFTDELGLNWTPDAHMVFGQTARIAVANETRKQYMTVRHFPADTRKYCYTLNVTPRTRYLVRATFLYGNFDNNNVYPKFDISVGPTRWSTIVISDANTIEVIELIFLATEPAESVCLYNGNTGQPFISTLELRQFNGSAYYTKYENQYYLGVSARINFGAESDAPVRYPEDPFDRIWASDTVKKANYLVDVAAGTERISTVLPIDANKDERPPVKVMQTAVVGRSGSLTYRLNLDGFPGFGWAVTYFAEIEDLAANESRKFRLVLPGNPDLSKPIVNIQENAQGKYRIYEPGFINITLPFVLSFKFAKTPDSTQGPLINAMEISKYVQKADASADGEVIASVVSHYGPANWTQEGGDPCLPVPWTWVECNSDPQPRITLM